MAKVSQVSQSEPTENGNTESVGSDKNQKYRYDFTLNNYSEVEVSQVRQAIEGLCKKGGFGFEVGEECKTPHLQGALWLKRKMRITALKKVAGFERASFREMRNEKAMIDYIQKDGDVWLFGFPPKPRIDKFVLEMELLEWQKKALEIHLTEPDRRSIYFFVGANVGKSCFLKWMLYKYPHEVKATTCKNANDVTLMAEDWVKTYIINYGQEVETYPYSALEELKDGFVTNAKLKKKMDICVQAPPHVFVFCNHEPWEGGLTEDKIKIIEVNERS